MAAESYGSPKGDSYLTVVDTGATFEISTRPGKAPTGDQSFRRGLSDAVWVGTSSYTGGIRMLNNTIYRSPSGIAMASELAPVDEYMKSPEAHALRKEKRSDIRGKFDMPITTASVASDLADLLGGQRQKLIEGLAMHGDAFCLLSKCLVEAKAGVQPSLYRSGDLVKDRSPLQEATHRIGLAGSSVTKRLERARDSLDMLIQTNGGPRNIPLLEPPKSAFVVDKKALASGDWSKVRTGGESASIALTEYTVQALVDGVAFALTQGGSVTPDFNYVLKLKEGILNKRANQKLAEGSQEACLLIQEKTTLQAKAVLAEQVATLVDMRGQVLQGEGYPIAPETILLDGENGEKVNLLESVKQVQGNLTKRRQALLVLPKKNPQNELELAQLTQALNSGEVIIALLERVQDIWGDVAPEKQEMMIDDVQAEGVREAIIETPQAEMGLALVDVAQMPVVTEKIAGASFDLEITVTEAQQIVQDLERLVTMKDAIGVNIAGETATMHIEGSKLREILADPNMPDVVKDRVASLIINTPIVGYPPREEMIDSVFSNITDEQRAAILKLRSRVTPTNRSEIINSDLMQDGIHYDLLKRRIRARLRATHPDMNQDSTDVVKAGAKAAYNLLNEVNQHIERMRSRGKGITKDDFFV